MAEIYYIKGTIYAQNRIIQNARMAVAETGKIRAIGGADLPIPDGAEVRDVSGLLVLPGFIDIHIHGGSGFGVMNATFADLDGISRFHASTGTTTFLATTSTGSLERLTEALKTAAAAIGKTSGAELAGIHLEGPYLDATRRGAQSLEHLRLPVPDEIESLLEAAKGHIRIVTLAPEIPGGYAAVRQLAQKGVTVSIGHSNATYEQVEEAVRNGVHHTTHHFNGMSPFHHRDPGVAGAGLMMPELTTELICDGIHVHPAAAKFLFETKSPDRVCLVTDAVPLAGMPDGVYGNHIVKDGAIRLADSGSLAGSSLSTLQAMKNAMRFTGWPLEKVLPSLTSVPARQAGLSESKGALAEGKDADFLLLTPDLQLVSTYVRGKAVYSAGQS